MEFIRQKTHTKIAKGQRSQRIRINRKPTRMTKYLQKVHVVRG